MRRCQDLIRGWVLGALVVAGVLLWVMSRPDVGDPMSSTRGDTADPSVVSAIPSRPDDAFPMTVEYVLDGDTVELQHRSPNDIVRTTAPVRVRLIGIDAPEGTPSLECWADEARDHLAALAPGGATIWVGLDPAGLDASWDPFGRRLYYLWTQDGRFLNYELAAAGDAEALRVGPNDAHHALFVTAQGAAQAAGAGQWGACGT